MDEEKEHIEMDLQIGVLDLPEILSPETVEQTTRDFLHLDSKKVTHITEL